MKRSPKVSSSAAAKTSVRERLERKVNVLTRWVEEGVPPSYPVPSSIRGLARWEDCSLGVERIGSPNDVTIGHPEHGAVVRRACGLMQALEDRARTTGAPRISERGKVVALRVEHLQFELERHRDRETRFVNQLHEARYAADTAVRLANSERERSAVLAAENRALTRELAELKAAIGRRPLGEVE